MSPGRLGDETPLPLASFNHTFWHVFTFAFPDVLPGCCVSHSIALSTHGADMCATKAEKCCLCLT
eukprot:6325685-Prymnesium_polylepis.1